MEEYVEIPVEDQERQNVEFFDILNTRLRANKSTLISANLDLGDLNRTYSERIVSRIVGNFKIFKFIGNDLRMH